MEKRATDAPTRSARAGSPRSVQHVGVSAFGGMDAAPPIGTTSDAVRGMRRNEFTRVFRRSRICVAGINKTRGIGKFSLIETTTDESPKACRKRSGGLVEGSIIIYGSGTDNEGSEWRSSARVHNGHGFRVSLNQRGRIVGMMQQPLYGPEQLRNSDEVCEPR